MSRLPISATAGLKPKNWLPFNICKQRAESSRYLSDKQLLTHHQGIYEVYDKFMSEWRRKL